MSGLDEPDQSSKERSPPSECVIDFETTTKLIFPFIELSNKNDVCVLRIRTPNL